MERANIETVDHVELRSAGKPDGRDMPDRAEERQTSLHERLACLRAQIVASGEKLLTWQEIEQEVARNRGHRSG